MSRAAELGLKLRAETDEDRGFTNLVYVSTRWEELAPVPWTEEQKVAFLLSQHDAQHRHYRKHYSDASWLVIEHSGRPVGRLYVVRRPHEIRVVDIALLPEWRGKGLGTALLGDLLDEAQDGGKSVSIHVERMNPAQSLYRRLGFEEVEDQGVYVLLERRPNPGGPPLLQVKIAS